LLEVEVHRQEIGRLAREFALREFTSAAAARYLELLPPVRERVGATDGGAL
jgi:hypothetical protein